MWCLPSFGLLQQTCGDLTGIYGMNWSRCVLQQYKICREVNHPPGFHWKLVCCGTAALRVSSLLRCPSAPTGCVCGAEPDSWSRETDEFPQSLKNSHMIAWFQVHKVHVNRTAKPQKELLFPSRGVEKGVICRVSCAYIMWKHIISD